MVDKVTLVFKTTNMLDKKLCRGLVKTIISIFVMSLVFD